MKAGDVGTKLRFRVLEKNSDEPMVLSNAESVKLITLLRGQRAEHDCAVDDALGGRISYEIAEGDLFDEGMMFMEVKVVFEDGKKWSSTRVEKEIAPSL